MAAHRIVIAGGGLAGFETARRLEATLEPGEARVTLVNPENFMVYQSLLPEVASGMIEPRHVVVPLRKTLPGTRVLAGSISDLDPDTGRATVTPYEGPSFDLDYDDLVVALGSHPKVLPVPGLADQALGLETVTDALRLRNHVLGCLEAAESAVDETTRRRALTFVFVGGGYTGVEAIGETEALAREATAYYPHISPADLRFVLVEAGPRILPMVHESLADYAQEALRARGVEVYTNTQLTSAEDGRMELSSGDTVGAQTLLWAPGVVPNPVLSQLDLDLTEGGAVSTDDFLRVPRHRGVWAAGDCAAVPDRLAGGTCPPSAQYALREARQLAANLTAKIRGEPAGVFRYSPLGEMLTIGRADGVAQIKGRNLRGYLPWWLRRMYHVGRVPSMNRKFRVWLDWTISRASRGDIVSLDSAKPERRFASEEPSGTETIAQS